MPAQPVRGGMRHMILGGGVMAFRPELAALAMQLIEIWSFANATILSIATKLLDSQPDVVMALLLGVTNHNARREAIAKAAEKRLSRNDFLLFKLAIERTGPSENKRHAFAHHIWGYSPEKPESLLLIDTENFVTRLADVEALEKTAPEQVSAFAGDVSKLRPYEWKKRDFEEAIQDAMQARIVIDQLYRFVAAVLSSPKGVADSMREQLLKDPVIRQRFDTESKPQLG